MRADMKQVKIDPGPIMEMSHAYWVSQVLYAATKLGVFTILADGSLTLHEIAERLKTPDASTEKLLTACLALGLLEKENLKYRNSALSGSYLVEGKAPYLGYFAYLMEDLYAAWGGLFDSVKKNGPVSERFAGREETAEEASRRFTLAMHSASSLSAPFLADAVDLSKNRKMIDIGGGSGINAIVLAGKNPNLEVVVYDFPSVIKVASGFIDNSDASKRIGVKAGDFEKDDLPCGFDCALLSHILHGLGAEGAGDLLKKCYDILCPGGKIMIVEFLLNEEKSGPLFPALFALNMLLETKNGTAFTAGEIKKLLGSAGFKMETVKRLGKLPASVICAIKIKR